MISVDEALSALFDLVGRIGNERVSLKEAAGRTLALPATAMRNQPPFDASSMDGYAMSAAEACEGARLRVIGEAAAGHAFSGVLAPGEAVRIFTGAPLPAGADHVEIQENVERKGKEIALLAPHPPRANIRAAGRDFAAGHVMDAPRLLSAADITLLAAMNVPDVAVARRPEVALISTGDELVMPGEAPRADQIIASNALGLHALLSEAGALPRILPIARDAPESLASAFRFARGADLVVTIGGASVGDHDLVQSVAGTLGLEQSFYKVAMRPGKPLIAGRLNGTPLIGLPGNPVSALVCGEIFVKPIVNVMLGNARAPRTRLSAPLAHAIDKNGPREHYMRANLKHDGLHVFSSQDSSLMSVLSQASALVVRPPNDGKRPAGDTVEYVPLSRPA